MGAIVGCVVGSNVAIAAAAYKTWIVPFAAGGLVYLALVSLLPQVGGGGGGGKGGWLARTVGLVAVVGGFVGGVYVMVLIALNE